MIAYYPWSQEVLNNCLDEYSNGKLPSLDLELTARCTQASCIYCDSKPVVGEKNPEELNYRETKNLIKNAKKLGLKWIYSCGLGEPLEDKRFKRLVEIASSLDIRISVFTNGILINQENAKWLKDNKVNLIIKLDTLVESTFDRILGKKGKSKKIFKAVDELIKAGYGKNCAAGCTDLAFSIVPTALNINDIPKVIKYAIDNNIFPSVGELEVAGRTLEKKTYSNLAINKKETLLLKERVEELLWVGYKRPICPTIVTGLHIDNIGNCIVDKETGLNCKWFLLKEPSVKIMGNIRRDNLSDLAFSVRNYRKKSFQKNDKKIRKCGDIDYIFGGCGGNPKSIINIARDYL